MIFISAGSTKFPFRRLESLASKFAKDNPDDKVVFQYVHPFGKTKPPNLEILTILNPEAFEDHLKNASLVVIHAGLATTMRAIKFSINVPVLFPRLKKYGEQVNDHQLYFAKFMAQKDLVRVLGKINNLKQKELETKSDQKRVKRYFVGVSERKGILIDHLNSVY